MNIFDNRNTSYYNVENHNNIKALLKYIFYCL